MYDCFLKYNNNINRNCSINVMLTWNSLRPKVNAIRLTKGNEEKKIKLILVLELDMSNGVFIKVH